MLTFLQHFNIIVCRTQAHCNRSFSLVGGNVALCLCLIILLPKFALIAIVPGVYAIIHGYITHQRMQRNNHHAQKSPLTYACQSADFFTQEIPRLAAIIKTLKILFIIYAVLLIAAIALYFVPLDFPHRQWIFIAIAGNMFMIAMLDANWYRALKGYQDQLDFHATQESA